MGLARTETPLTHENARTLNHVRVFSCCVWRSEEQDWRALAALLKLPKNVKAPMESRPGTHPDKFG